jgi:general secretion pathway protein D
MTAMTRSALTSCTVALLCGVLALPPAGLAWAQPARGSNSGNSGHAAAMKSKTPVTLNFVNSDIEAVTRVVSAMIQRPIVVDPRVKGTMTLYSEQPMTVREAYLNYMANLRGMGFAVVEVSGMLKVVPEAEGKLQSGVVQVGENRVRGDQILTQVYKLNHENPNNLVAVLRPLITPNNTINANPGTNSLVITDYADNLDRIGKIIAALDVPAATDLEIIALKNAVAVDLAPLVQRLADGSGGGGGGVPGVPGLPGGGGGAVSILPDARSNSLIVRAANQARMSQVKGIIDKLDRAPVGSGATGNIWVVHLKNADAVKLAQVLRAAFAGGGSGGAGGGGGAGAGSITQAATPAPTPPGAPGGQSALSAAPVQASAGPSTGGFIQADPSTNSLIITAAEPLYRQVRAMIDQLDSRRAQVYIESLIVEVTGDNAAEFGIQWQGLIGQKGDSSIVGLGTNFPGAANIINLSAAVARGRAGVADVDTSQLGGLNIGVLRDFGGFYGVGAVMRMLQNQTNANIMSAPNLVTLDNEEAKIVIGDNVPFITGSFTSTGTGTTNPFQTIERRDVGLTLRIKPQIGEGNTIRMAIFQESSNVITQATGTTGTGPTTSKREIQSNVVVDDGQMFVIGGLIEDRFEDTKFKVPLLGDVPVLGALFRSETRSKKRTNLLVFLRPVVMRTAEDASKLSMDRYDYIRSQQQAAQPAPNFLLPINSAPVLPAASQPARAASAATPSSAPAQ